MSQVPSEGLNHGTERRYVAMLVLGFVIMALGAIANASGLSPPTTIQQPNPADIDQFIDVATPFPKGFTEYFGLAIGAAVNLYSVRKYANDSYSLKDERYPRRSMLISAGLLATFLIMAVDIVRLLS